MGDEDDDLNGDGVVDQKDMQMKGKGKSPKPDPTLAKLNQQIRKAMADGRISDAEQKEIDATRSQLMGGTDGADEESDADTEDWDDDFMFDDSEEDKEGQDDDLTSSMDLEDDMDDEMMDDSMDGEDGMMPDMEGGMNKAEQWMDINCDGTVDEKDDLNGDGEVDEKDMMMAQKQDKNGDGCVDAKDSMQKHTPPPKAKAHKQQDGHGKIKAMQATARLSWRHVIRWRSSLNPSP